MYGRILILGVRSSVDKRSFRSISGLAEMLDRHGDSAGPGKGFVQHRFQQPPAFGLAGGELRFQPVAQGQQFIDLGDDAVLVGKGRRGMPMGCCNVVRRPRQRFRTPAAQ